MPACEYCGEHYPKGGALATHQRHCDEKVAAADAETPDSPDHSPSSSPEKEPPDPDGQDQTLEHDGVEDRVEFTATEVDDTPEPAAREENKEVLKASEIEDTTPAETTPSEPADTGTDTSQMDTTRHLGNCPECGSELMDGEKFETWIEMWAERREEVAKWALANQDTEFDRACSDPFGCGYYVTPDERAAEFTTPTSLSGGGALGSLLKGVALGGLGLLGAAAATALGNQNQDDEIRTL